MSKHTPGPWVWNYNRSLYQVGDGKPYDYGSLVAYASSEYETGTNIIVSDADACLIAAAPDLLCCCIRAAEQFEYYEIQHRAKNTTDADAKADANKEMARLIRAAIARATGAA